ncbi:MFS transporter [Streptomyces sp. NPDC049577]|uniref:MFS transporter n=1 Tax=Streptomyces sp. NPDC049577 TaxID=3155153 RepID=UPI00343437B9
MGYIRLLRRRPVRVLWLSMTLSVIGDRLYGLATMWVVYAATRSSSLMGLVAVVESLPYIVLGGAGSVMARFADWRPLARVDATRAVIAVAVPLLWLPGADGFAVLLCLVLLLGTLGAVFDPNLGALIPRLAGPEDLQQLSGLFDLTTRIAGVVGQGGVGALLLLVSVIQLYAIDGLTFAVSAAALAWLSRHTGRAHIRPGTKPAPAPAPAPASVPAPAPAQPVRAIVRAHRQAGIAIAVHAAAYFATTVSTVGLPPLLADRLGQGPAGYGLTLSASAAGALAGNLLTCRLPEQWPWLGTYCAAWSLSGLSLAGLGVAPSVTAVIVLCVVSGLLFPVSVVTLRAHLSRFTPPVRLRLLTADQVAVRTAGTAGMLLMPLAVDAAPAQAFVGAGALLSVLALAGWWLGGRTPDRPVPLAGLRRGVREA